MPGQASQNNAPQPIVDLLEQHGQLHLVKWWDELDASEQSRLVEQIEQIDFPLVSRLVAEHTESGGKKPAQSKTASPQPPAKLERFDQNQPLSGQAVAATRAGEELLRQQKIAAMVVAGGQGSRLGFDHPKGMFPIGPITGKTLFQLHFEQLEALSRKYGVSIPYFIMTSEATDAETKEFLEANEYFGHSLHDVYIFKQGWLPAVDENGKILLASKGEIATSPDGHGGMLKALKRSGLIDILHERGIEHVYYHQIDNPTAILCDPTFLGMHVRYQSGMSTKVVKKTHAGEKMGVVVDIDGATQIIEYSDLSAQQQEATDDDGDLLLWAGNTAIHAFSCELLDRLTDGDASLPYHRAHKKVSHLDEAGKVVEPESPNAYKFEQFIFDALPEAKNALVMEASRDREFNPVKNAEGADSPETSRNALLAIARSWCEEAEVPIQPDARVEISPLYAMSPSDLQDVHHSTKPLAGDVYLEPEEIV